MTTSSCATCGESFSPVLAAQVHCASCRAMHREIGIVQRHLRTEPGDLSYEAVSKATGVTVARLQRLAAKGALETSPINVHDCTCPPGETGRCPACRDAIARGFGRAVGEIRIRQLVGETRGSTRMRMKKT